MRWLRLGRIPGTNCREKYWRKCWKRWTLSCNRLGSGHWFRLWLARTWSGEENWTRIWMFLLISNTITLLLTTIQFSCLPTTWFYSGPPEILGWWSEWQPDKKNEFQTLVLPAEHIYTHSALSLISTWHGLTVNITGHWPWPTIVFCLYACIHVHVYSHYSISVSYDLVPDTGFCWIIFF